MKGSKSSELKSIENISNFDIFPYGRNEFVSKENPSKLDINLAQEGFDYVSNIIDSGRYDVVILDEINVALDFGLVSLNKVIKLIKNKPKNLELVLTGRNAPEQLIELADLVTEMKEIKHPFQKGILARKGIDY